MTLVNPSIRPAFGQFVPNVATANYVVPTPAIVFPHDFLVMCALMPFNGATTPTITSVPAGWTSLWQATCGPTTDPAQGAYSVYAAYKRSSGAELASYTWVSGVSDRPSCVMVAVRDAAAVLPLNAAGGFAAGANVAVSTVKSSLFTTPTITPDPTNLWPLVPSGAFIMCPFFGFYGSAPGSAIQASSPLAQYGTFINGNNGSIVTIGGLAQGAKAAFTGHAASVQAESTAAGILAFMPTWLPYQAVVTLNPTA